MDDYVSRLGCRIDLSFFTDTWFREVFRDVGSKVEHVDGRVQDVQVDVHDVGNKVQDVDNRVQGIGSDVNDISCDVREVNRSSSL